MVGLLVEEVFDEVVSFEEVDGGLENFLGGEELLVGFVGFAGTDDFDEVLDVAVLEHAVVELEGGDVELELLGFEEREVAGVAHGVELEELGGGEDPELGEVAHYIIREV